MNVAVSQTTIQFSALTPEGHRFMVGVRVVPKIELYRPIVLLDPSFYQFAHGNRFSRTDVHNPVFSNSHGERNKRFRDFSNGQVVAQLLAPRHVEYLIPSLDCSFELQQQGMLRLTIAIQVEEASPSQRK